MGMGCKGAARALRGLGFRSAVPYGGGRDKVFLLFPPEVRRSLVCVDVQPDGHCGASVLAIVAFAMTRIAAGQAEVRQRVYHLACGVVRGALPAFAREFARTFRPIRRDAWLSDSELVLFLHAQGLSACTVTPARGRLHVQSFPRAGATGYVFLIFSRGCHWQILARRGGRDGAFSPVWSLRSGAWLLRHMRRYGSADVQRAPPPEVTLTTLVNGVPLFRLDALDRQF